MIVKIKNYLLLFFLIVLPFQTRLIYKSVFLKGTFWEYGSLSLYGTELLLALIVVFDLISRLKNKEFRKRLTVFRTQPALSVVGLLSVLAIYYFSSLNREVTWQYLNYVIYGACLMIIIAQNGLSKERLTLALWGGGLVQALFAISQFFTQNIFANKWLGMANHNPGELGTAVIEFGDQRWLRAYGVFGWPNALGIYLAAIFLFGIILILSSKSKRDQLYILLGQIIILVGLFFSFARGAWLALAISGLVIIWKNYKNIFLWQQLAIYGLVAIILVFTFKPLLFSRFNLQNRLEQRSISEREQQWQDFKVVFSNHQFLGVGPGAYTYGLYQQQLYHGYDFQPVHNIYLLFLGEWGLLGAAIFLSGLSFVYKKINFLFPPLFCVLLAGFFDHWSLSMFTGIAFLGILVAFSWRFSGIDTISTKE